MSARPVGKARPVLSVAVAALCLLAGCAKPSGVPGASGSEGGTSALTALAVSVDAGSGSAPTTCTLTCDPPGGSHPQASAACAQLAAAKTDPFAKTPGGMMCSMIYGGAQTATVTGTFRGRRVETRFARTNGCEVARWELVSALLVIPAGGG